MLDSRTGDDGLARQIGSIIRSTREEIGWGQRELAARIGCSRSALQRIEAGDASYIDARLATNAFRVLGIRSTFDARTLGLATRREQRDLVHACCLGFVARRLRAHGWDVRVEVEIGTGRYRGWIDLLAFRARDRSLLTAEIKTEVHDAGRIQRTIGWYGREAPVAARALGWRPQSMAEALLILCSTDNDRSVRLNHDLLRSTFPGSARALADWVADPVAPVPPASIAMIDPRSRRAEWLRATASDGRRTAAPYAGYAELAAILRQRVDGRP